MSRGVGEKKKKKREMLGKQMAGTLGMRAVPLIKIASGFLQVNFLILAIRCQNLYLYP